MKVSESSSVPVYTISGSSTGRPLPEWLARKRKRSLKNDPEYASRIELLQDFHFEEASTAIRVSEDGQWVVSTGTYKPQYHVHYLPHLSLSYEHHTDALNTTFQLLSGDYTKQIHLQSDRSIEFHTPQGCHYRSRIPRYGRDLKYDRRAAEALVPAVGINANGLGEVYRLNLELGRFMRPYELEVGGDDLDTPGAGALQGGVGVGGVNTAAIAEESHNLHAFGTSIGTVEFWDPRSRKRAGILAAASQHDFVEGRQEITALDFHRSGLSIATGSSTGLVQTFDLRATKPLMKRDQGFGVPIHTLIHLTPSTGSEGRMAEEKLLSADKRMIKIWDDKQETTWTSIEPAVDLNDVAWCKDSGMLLTANEGRQQHAFFIPQLGPAPKWCAFLDNLVEEMAEDPGDPNAYASHRAGEVYDNYKFLTMEQLETLSMAHLVGTTGLLRPYMHGYFVPQKLYEEAKMIADPFIWEEQRAKRVRERIEKERDSRIRGNKKTTTKVNRKLADKLIEQEEKRQRREARRVLDQGGDEPAIEKQADKIVIEGEGEGEIEVETKPAGTILEDSRFAGLFTDERFAVDENDPAYIAHNPNPSAAILQERSRGLTAVEQEAVDDVKHSSSDDASSSEDDRPAKPKSDGRISTGAYHQRFKQKSGPKMQVKSSSRPVVDRTFGSRKPGANPREKRERTRTAVGEKEMSFMPASARKKKEAESRPSQASGKRGDRRSASGNTFRFM